MTRLAELTARRAALLTRCAQQRVELARLLSELRPELLRSSAGAAAGGDAGRAARHPLAWLVVLAGLTLFGRTREVLSLLVFMRSAVSFAARAAQLLRLLGHWRAARSHTTPESAATGHSP